MSSLATDLSYLCEIFFFYRAESTFFSTYNYCMVLYDRCQYFLLIMHVCVYVLPKGNDKYFATNDLTSDTLRAVANILPHKIYIFLFTYSINNI